MGRREAENSKRMIWARVGDECVCYILGVLHVIKLVFVAGVGAISLEYHSS